MTVFFAFHFAGRVLGVPISAFLRPRTMLLINLAITAAAYFLLLFVNFSGAILWVTAAAAGLAMASTFASMVLWMSETMTITGRISALLLIGASLGGMTAAPLVGQLIDNVGAMCMVYVLIAAGLIHIVLFALIWVCVSKRRRLLAELDVKI